MEESKKLHQLLDNQKDFLINYEKTLKEIDAIDFVSENDRLKKEINKYTNIANELKLKNLELSNDNDSLKLALKEQILDEKLNILKISKEKLNLYFKSTSEEYSNGLLQLESETNKKIQELRNTAFREMLDINNEFYLHLDNLKNELKGKVEVGRDKFNLGREEINSNAKLKFENLSNQEIDQKLIEKRKKQNDFEIKVGLGWINKIGIFLILLGISYAFKYSYTEWFTKEIKGIMGFVVGILFLIAGEIFYKNNKDVFSKGLIGGGIGILYFAVFHSYFNLELIGMYNALIICVLISLVTLVLSIRYDSQTIANFSLIGGFMPFFTYVFQIGLGEGAIIYACGYLFILNIMLLSISLNKGWRAIKFISFLLNVPSLIYLIGQSDSFAVQMSYTVITFIMYLLITLIFPFRNKVKLLFWDIFILGLNTFISCLLIYALFEDAGFTKFRGLLAIGFCIIYFALGLFIEKYMNEETQTKGIFYLTALTFAVLVIPFQFTWKWVIVGWTVEGMLLTIYGYKNKFINTERSGIVVFAICTFAFFIAYIEHFFADPSIDFDIKYITYIIGNVAILFTYLYGIKDDIIGKYGIRAIMVNIYKYFVILSTWIYGIYICNRLYDIYAGDISYRFDEFYKSIIFALVTLIIAFLASNIKLLYDRGIKVFSIIMYILADLVCMTMNSFTYLPSDESYEVIRNISLVILVIYNIFVLFNIRWLIISFLRAKNRGFELYPLAIGIYLVGTLTSLLINQFNLGDENLLFSLLYVGLSFTYIIYGFIRNFSYIRRFGLALLMFATAKLFLYDLAYLEIGGKIIAYFGFGFTMLAISYVYQKLKQNTDNNGIKHNY